MTRPKVGSHLDYSCRPCHYPPCVCIAPRAHLSPHPLPISLPLSLSPSLPPSLLHGIAEAQLYFQFKSIERYTNCVKLAASINPDPGADQVQAWVNGGDGGDPMPLEELIAKCTERVTIAEKGIKYITKNVTAVVAAYEKQQNAVQKLAKTMQVRVRERKRERERERGPATVIRKKSNCTLHLTATLLFTFQKNLIPNSDSNSSCSRSTMTRSTLTPKILRICYDASTSLRMSLKIWRRSEVSAFRV